MSAVVPPSPPTVPAEESVEPVPLIPRRRMIGSMLGAYTSMRRGEGTDIAGSRPYRPGDPSRLIDWKASARLSATSGGDQFIVRERYAHEMPRVVLIVDRRPEMSLYPADSPWLSKVDAVRNVVDLLVVSAVNQRGLVGYLDFASHDDENESGQPYWRPPRAQSGSGRATSSRACTATSPGASTAPPTGSTARSTSSPCSPAPCRPAASCSSSRTSSQPPPADSWSGAIDRGWDVVAGRRPGSRVGAELPADRRRRDTVRRGPRAGPAVRQAERSARRPSAARPIAPGSRGSRATSPASVST